ncbi:MAG: AmmeMemoRadiSam system protein B [Gammaproteobacteria bacterium]|nr:AmmeMemoRadiSam system protein B [Gammaproteobacteria bacterium]MDH3372824.1 AmmeMemoRadiSam system protein B [Gammaproteobacteria bacterium]MDH3407978.1 AmmeMemoRadiSam system protein B [Gammaproteobacteria bacterium]MDH3551297.1 AmmeMemoRadiSam system protein B [Gammaproteobacteria bacterium]
MTVIREPAVAGSFYPGNAPELGRTVEFLLEEAKCGDVGAPKALIAPHAGYIYSGAVAAAAYARLRPYRDQYERVILLGPCHRVPVRGFALSSADVFRTPIGDVPLDTQAIAGMDIPLVEVFDDTHIYEHSLEVHLPFLQSVLGSFSLVPIVVGNTTPECVAEVLDALWGGPETLIVISSDLSHYLSYDQARAVDGETRRAIEDLDVRGIDHDTACGATPIGGLLITAKRRGMRVNTLDLCNSGDTAGDRRNVVGYGSWVFVEQ